MNHLFGPVRSRRLGLSLGVDLLPFKTCSMNCVYCECGPTTSHTAGIMEYFPTVDVIAELDAFLAPGPELDVITFAGSGEPTLHSGLGDIIGFIKTKYPRYRVAVLTNGSLFWREEARRAVLAADIIAPSLDAVSPEAFRKINRPVRALDPAKIVEGLISLRSEFRGELRLEVFIVPGVNDSPGELALIRDAALRIRPDIVQLNTLDRPGTDPSLAPADREALERIRDFMAPLRAEIIGAPDYAKQAAPAGSDAVLATLKRRPSTAGDLAASLGMDAAEIERALAELERAGIVEKRAGERGEFYSAK
ncbi:MAG: radical SAM protein [Spirochaetes bacterium]|nr:radical SAM protein [Spirochaetota bacterium]